MVVASKLTEGYGIDPVARSLFCFKMPPLSCTTVTQTMPSTTKDHPDHLLAEEEVVHDDCDLAADATKSPATHATATHGVSEEKPPMKIVWRNVILFAYLHMAAVYGAYLMFASAMWQTNLFAIFLYLISGIGVTAGAHRLWAHRSYKAKLPLRILLAFIYTIAFENDIYEWARDHRVHHKYSETDADPHNATRGFFFAHIGWLLCRKHPEVIRKGKAIDTSDLLADPVVRFQRKFYLPLVVLCCFYLPTVIPMYGWGESFSNAFFVATLLRFCFTLNQTWLVNSAAHMWGDRPYDTTINPRQNALVVLGAVGEGFHNYHHTFPYDYATSEYGIKYNLTTAFIDAMALLGLAYDRKTASRGMIKARKARTGEDRPGNTNESKQNGVHQEVKQNGVHQEVKQNGVHQEVKQNGVHQEVKQNGVHQEVKQNGVHQEVKQNGAHQEVKQNGVHQEVDLNGVHLNVKQNGVHHESKSPMNGVEHEYTSMQNGVIHESKFPVNGVLHESKLAQNGINGVHKRIAQFDEISQNGVRTPVLQNGGLKED